MKWIAIAAGSWRQGGGWKTSVISLKHWLHSPIRSGFQFFDRAKDKIFHKDVSAAIG